MIDRRGLRHENWRALPRAHRPPRMPARGRDETICQYHLKSTLAGSTFTDAEAWEAFAAQEYRIADIGKRVAEG